MILVYDALQLHRSGVFALKTADGGNDHKPGYTEYRTSKRYVPYLATLSTTQVVVKIKY